MIAQQAELENSEPPLFRNTEDLRTEMCSDFMQAVPIAVTALLPLSLLPFFGILTADKTAAAYFNDTQALFLGSFILALAVEK
jgi:di/tricarboxylate transporter